MKWYNNGTGARSDCSVFFHTTAAWKFYVPSFSRSDTTVTKVTIEYCSFGTAEDASRLLAAFETSRTVTDLTLCGIESLEGAALGARLFGLLRNMPQLQRFACTGSIWSPCISTGTTQANRITLRELDLQVCDIDDEGIHFLADALVGNTTMSILNIGSNGVTSIGLDDITRLLESTRLKKFDMQENYAAFDNEASTQRFARVLARHEFLKELNISGCLLGDAGISIIVDGLVGNATMEILGISFNIITSNGLDDITRLFESTRLQSIALQYNEGIFDDEKATQRFVSTFQQQNSSVQELPGFRSLVFPVNIRAAALTNIHHSLTRNRQLNHVNLLLVPPSRGPQQQHQQYQRNHAGTMMLKISHKAITKFATVPNNAGASAIFKLFTARPQLLEKRLQRPAAAAVVISREQKRRRL
jgi:Leucine Rich repeat